MVRNIDTKTKKRENLRGEKKKIKNLKVKRIIFKKKWKRNWKKQKKNISG